jgi:hypothetical protein
VEPRVIELAAIEGEYEPGRKCVLSELCIERVQDGLRVVAGRNVDVHRVHASPMTLLLEPSNGRCYIGRGAANLSDAVE